MATVMDRIGPTMRVVCADVMSCLLPGPECGSSSSVIRKTRFVADLGALLRVMVRYAL